MKIGVIHEDHSKYTEKFPFIYHYDILATDTTFSDEIGRVSTNTHVYYCNCPVNWHNNVEFLCFREGKAQLFCGNETYTATPSSLYIINSNVLHRVSGDPCTGYHCLIVDKDFFTENDIPINTLTFRNSDPKDAEMIARFDRITAAFGCTDSFRLARIRAAVLDFLAYVAETYGKSDSAENDTDRSVASVKLAIRYINEHLTDKLSLADVAAAAGMSKYYFASEFRRSVGYTCVEYINNRRCLHAKTLLLTGDYSVSEVCFMCGFENLSYFSKTFCRYIGMSPSECKKSKNRQEDE